MIRKVCLLLAAVLFLSFVLNGCGWEERVRREIIMQRLEEMGDE